MRLRRRERAARRHEAWALRCSDAGRHPWAIDAADEAVALLRPVAVQHPSAMARALATRAACLHVRGRRAEAVRDVEQCLAYRDQARGPASRVDLAYVAMLLERSGRTDEALALAEQLVADARAFRDPRSAAPMVVYGDLLLRHERVEEAVVVLREAYATAPRRSAWRVQASAVLFEALGAAGRDEELEEHAYRNLPAFAMSAWAGVGRRLVYIHLLKVLEHHHVASSRLPPLAAVIARQRRKLVRQLRRRRALAAVVAVLTGRLRDLPDRPRAATGLLPSPERAAALARVARAESEVERRRESGDPRTLSEAWGALAEARWQAGGQKSAALDAQRAALAAARRWAAEHPDEARPALAVHLRRFADYAGIIGLRHDAQPARAEAEELDRADR